MFFYVDESGHTGKNLFDETQPCLYYGVLSSTHDLDEVAGKEIEEARQRKDVERLHASDLGMGGLVDIHDCLVSVQEKYALEFDIWRVVKPDHAVISFFDQVFDQGVNLGMTWTGYWTPLRYTLLVIVAQLFDIELAERAWKARINTNTSAAESELVDICQELLTRLAYLPDARAREIIGNSLQWVIEYPSTVSYNCKSKKDVLDITPNVIGFQSVMHGIASRLESPDAFARITVDQQTQFNKAQKSLALFYAKTRDVDWTVGPGLPKMDLSKMPTSPISFKSSKNSVGLELVDSYLWIFKRIFEGKEVAEELLPLVKPQLNRGNTSEVSISASYERSQEFLSQLPQVTEDQLKAAQELRKMQEKNRWRGVNLTADLL